MRILLFMPGFPQYQEPFWKECFEDTGLADYTDIGKQINALSSRLYPSEILAEYNGDTDAIAARFYDWTRWRMDDEYQPKPYTHLMIDTEPQKRDLPGDDPQSAWGWMKIREGYNADDVAYLNAMLEGASKATGLPIGHYRIPGMFHAPVGKEHEDRLESAKPIMRNAQWIWQHEYANKIVTRESAARAQQIQVTQRLALRRYGLPIYNAIWPGRYLAEDEVVGTYEHVLWSSKRWNDDYVILWLDLDHPVDYSVHVRNMRALAPTLLKFL